MKINKVFEKIKGKKIIIIGDSMVDSYVLGEINRNSPEAPVPIVDVKQEDTKLGDTQQGTVAAHEEVGETHQVTVAAQEEVGEET